MVRGDYATKHGLNHTTSIIKQVNDYNNGVLVDGSSIREGVRFHYGVAAYPEKHYEAPNIDADLDMLKRKQDIGAVYAITQLFYDNTEFFNFCDRARKRGVTIPIVPGIKPITKPKQLQSLPGTFFCNIPNGLYRDLSKVACSESDFKKVGVEATSRQCEELYNKGVNCIHFFTYGTEQKMSYLR